MVGGANRLGCIFDNGDVAFGSEAANAIDLGALANVQPPEDLIGVTPLSEPPPGEALSVLRAQAEGQRTLAEARIARAAALPGLSATAALTQDRATPGLRLGGAQIGLGSPAALAASVIQPTP